MKRPMPPTAMNFTTPPPGRSSGGEVRQPTTGADVAITSLPARSARKCGPPPTVIFTTSTETWSGTAPSSDNFLVWWDGDLSRELEDGTSITKYSTSGTTTLLTATGLRVEQRHQSHALPGGRHSRRLAGRSGLENHRQLGPADLHHYHSGKYKYGLSYLYPHGRSAISRVDRLAERGLQSARSYELLPGLRHVRSAHAKYIYCAVHPQSASGAGKRGGNRYHSQPHRRDLDRQPGATMYRIKRSASASGITTHRLRHFRDKFFRHKRGSQRNLLLYRHGHRQFRRKRRLVGGHRIDYRAACAHESNGNGRFLEPDQSNVDGQRRRHQLHCKASDQQRRALTRSLPPDVTSTSLFRHDRANRSHVLLRCRRRERHQREPKLEPGLGRNLLAFSVGRAGHRHRNHSRIFQLLQRRFSVTGRSASSNGGFQFVQPGAHRRLHDYRQSGVPEHHRRLGRNYDPQLHCQPTRVTWTSSPRNDSKNHILFLLPNFRRRFTTISMITIATSDMVQIDPRRQHFYGLLQHGRLDLDPVPQQWQLPGDVLIVPHEHLDYGGLVASSSSSSSMDTTEFSNVSITSANTPPRLPRLLVLRPPRLLAPARQISASWARTTAENRT